MNLWSRIGLAKALALCWPAMIAAQVGLSLPVINNATTGQVVTMPVTVLNFDSISAAQFVLRWNPAVLEYQSVSNFNLPGLDIEDFGLTNALDSGYIRFAWTAPFLNSGVTLADGVAIFNLKLKVIGGVGTGSEVRFTELVPTIYFEIVNANGQTFNINQALLDHGFVAVGYTLNTPEPSGALLDAQLNPNPGNGDTCLGLELERAATLQYMITDGAGRCFQRRTLELTAGMHRLDIAASDLPAGLYYVVLFTPDAVQALPWMLY